jgi:GH15 family glucan-1,4-alpha-glucosidase
VMDALSLVREAGIPPDPQSWSLQRLLVDHLETCWREPDAGIWEVRGEPRHFTYSKVMAWVAFDRAIEGVEKYGQAGPVERWHQLRDEIHAEVCEKGFDAERNTFTQSYGSPALDASLLLIPQVGFLPPTDPRVVGTIEAVQRELTHDGLVLRYRDRGENVDGLTGEEGTFLACSFWLADGLHLIGRTDEARELFTRLVALCNDVGLLAEEYSPKHGRMLGNFPQAYSHIALVNTAFRLQED